MKIFLVSILLFGCTNSKLASIGALGRIGKIKCYSGGVLILDATSTGRISTVTESDGWEFEDEATGKFVRVSGTCVIYN